jgi:hypothetical protein
LVTSSLITAANTIPASLICLPRKGGPRKLEITQLSDFFSAASTGAMRVFDPDPSRRWILLKPLD